MFGIAFVAHTRYARPMVIHINKNNRYMPSLKKHGLSAALLLAIIGLSGYTWLNFVAKNQTRSGDATLEINLPEPVAKPNTPDAPLPDLLSQDNIPLDENPTEALKTEEISTLNPVIPAQDGDPATATGPKTILIDGTPIGVNAGRTQAATALEKAPIEGFSQMSPSGRIPQKAEDGRMVLEVYAKPFTPVPSRKYISLVVGGLGINPTITRKAINELPSEVTLSFAAQAPGLQSWIDQARARGHEVMIEIPMENANPPKNTNANNPATSYIITTTNSPNTNIRNLNFLISRAEGYFALTNYGGEKLVRNEPALKPVLEHMESIGLGFIYDGSTKGARIWHVGRRHELPIITADGFIDEQSNTRADVRQAIAALGRETDRLVPIGMGFSFGGTIDGISDWLKTKPDTLYLAPASYALKRN